jgi:ligand-binding SRPBCC domain-containing protein
MRVERWVPVPLDKVFGFFSNPANLPRIMPEELAAELVSVNLVPPTGLPSNAGAPMAGVGSEIVVSIRPIPALPLRTPWVARITEFEMNRRFADVQAKGPFKSWHHRHEFEAAARDGRNGTIVGDVLEYEVGLGWLGALAQRLFVGRQMQRTFEHRQRRLEQLLLGAS